MNPQFAGFPDCGNHISRMDQYLGRDAPDVEASASQLPFVYEGDPKSSRLRPECYTETLASTNHDNVILFHGRLKTPLYCANLYRNVSSVPSLSQYIIVGPVLNRKMPAERLISDLS
jgi:hypothetical protein